MISSRTRRLMRLALLALLVSSVVLIVWNWNASPWWELPVGLAAGYAASIILWCVIPPRFPLPWPWPRLAAAIRKHRKTVSVREIRKITLAMGAGTTYEVGGPYTLGDATAGTVDRIVKDAGGYRVYSDRGRYQFFAEHYVDPASVAGAV